MRSGKYFVYITTNKNKTVLYTGVTNNLQRRIYEHQQKSVSGKPSFVQKYNLYHLIYFEVFENALSAIAREKQIKGWKRDKKEALIQTFNPAWDFLNDTIY